MVPEPVVEKRLGETSKLDLDFEADINHHTKLPISSIRDCNASVTNPGLKVQIPCHRTSFCSSVTSKSEVDGWRSRIHRLSLSYWSETQRMANKPNKLAFLSQPAPASYVAGLGRG